jgi:SAM-dependent methyltransferase
MFSRSAHIYDAIYSFKDYAAEAERVHELIAERAPGAKTLLDVACGTGTHLEQLARWYEIEGLDLDAGLLEVARERLPGVPLHEADMASFDLGRTFDAVTCLFSAIGYLTTPERLGQGIAAMARHLAPDGVLVVEPWILLGSWDGGRPHMLTLDRPDLKIARVSISSVEGRLSIVDFSYLVGTPEGVEHFAERHEAALYTDEEYRQAFTDAGLAVGREEEGLMGRGIYVGTRP